MTTLWRYSLYQHLTDTGPSEITGAGTERIEAGGGGVRKQQRKRFSRSVTSPKASISLFILPCLLALTGSENSHN